MASVVVIILIGVVVAGIINIAVGKLWSNFGERWVAGEWVNRTVDRDAIPGVIIYLPEKKNVDGGRDGSHQRWAKDTIGRRSSGRAWSMTG